MRRTAREVLNELRWRNRDRLGSAVLWVRDRMRAEGVRLVRGEEIVELERRYFATASGRLPYYKIDRIECDGEVVFVREEREGP